MNTPSLVFSPADARRAMRLSLVEGSVWAVMVGLGETFFVADAVRLGASPLQLGLTVALPLAVGALGPLYALAVLRGARRRKGVVVGAVLLQASALAALALLEYHGRSTANLLIGLACVYQWAGQTAGNAWSSWFGDVVPSEARGHYFARRTALVHLSTCAGLLLGGFLLNLLEPGAPGAVVAGRGGLGFASIFALASVFRFASVFLLVRSPEPAFRGLPDRAGVLRFLGSGRGRMATRLILIGGVLHLTVYASAPYFQPFMLKVLQFSYAQYTLASVWVVVWKAMLLHFWGRQIDRRGPRVAFGAALVLVGLVPLPWVFANGLAMVLFAQLVSAFSWSGHEVSSFTLLLASTTRRTRPQAFAAQSLVHGGAQLVGTTLGAALLPLLGGEYRHLFALSAGARLVVAVWAMLWLPSTVRRVQRVPVSLRVLGMRPHGGPVHRPVSGDEGD